MRPLPLLAIAAVFLPACGGDSSTAPPAWKVKLADHAQAVLVDTTNAPVPTRVLACDEGGPAEAWEVWRSATDPGNAFHDEPGVLERSVDEGVLTLSGKRGFVYTIASVEPSTCYRFRVRARARDLEFAPLPPGTDDFPFYGTTPWLAELSRDGTPEEVLANGPDEFLVDRHIFLSGGSGEGWRELELTFVTGPDTRALLAALVLSFDRELSAGAVDFTDVSLEKLPLSAQWSLDRAEAAADFARGELPLAGWRAKNLVRGLLGAEVRPSVLLFPGERLSYSVTIPAGRPVLETGLGVWAPALLPGTPRGQVFHVRVDGEPVLEFSHPAPDDPADARWRDETIDLSDWAGEEVTLELSVDGSIPGLFGAPVLRDASRSPARQNLLLISIDTLRADFVGSYGASQNPFPDNLTPNLDRLASQGIRCAHVEGQAPYTLPGHATLLSGQFPSVHGVQRTTQAISRRRSPLLAETLSAAGYRTQAFTGGGFVNADFGFDRGFDGFANIDPLRQRDAQFFQAVIAQHDNALRRLRRNGRRPQRITQELVDEYGPDRIASWLADHKGEPFFLFVHTYTVHDYDPPEAYRTCHEELGCTSYRTDYDDYRLTRANGWTRKPISDADRDHAKHLYAESLRFVDDEIGDLMATLDRLGLADTTVVAVVTDHGEELFERGFRQHGKTLYEELTRLPMMFRLPGREPGVIEEPVMQVDLSPTLLGALGFDADPRMQGIDLLAGSLSVRPTWSEIHDDFVHKYALRSEDGWKILFAPEDETVSFPAPYRWKLFDLDADPAESRDLSAENPERLAEMREELRGHREALEAYGQTLEAVDGSEVSEDTLRQLAELGYGGGGKD
ncbi:MAG TPA: hypothetical protein ENJ09_00080 [Planctomycetes bacterium]|nr:hypothetical protein [Planctomycetota bacterium]